MDSSAKTGFALPAISRMMGAMMQFHVTEAFWELFPEVQIGLVLAYGIDNTGELAPPNGFVADAWASSAAALADLDIATHPAVAPWRAAYTKFGMKPSKYRSSIESMLRAAQAGRFRPINPLVDLYNAVSLRYQLPCGGEDLAAIVGDVYLTRAAGGEAFRTIGASTDEPPVPGEVIYTDSIGAICRCWNWREADRTKLVPTTRDALLVIEALPEHDPAQLVRALDDLASQVSTLLGGRTRQVVVTRQAPSCELHVPTA
jgi:DNA/RNA-binding domain of Phe-tRNA-synthetase-like protein